MEVYEEEGDGEQIFPGSQDISKRTDVVFERD